MKRFAATLVVMAGGGIAGLCWAGQAAAPAGDGNDIAGEYMKKLREKFGVEALCLPKNCPKDGIRVPEYEAVQAAAKGDGAPERFIEDRLIAILTNGEHARLEKYHVAGGPEIYLKKTEGLKDFFGDAVRANRACGDKCQAELLATARAEKTPYKRGLDAAAGRLYHTETDFIDLCDPGPCDGGAGKRPTRVFLHQEQDALGPILAVDVDYADFSWKRFLINKDGAQRPLIAQGANESVYKRANDILKGMKPAGPGAKELAGKSKLAPGGSENIQALGKQMRDLSAAHLEQIYEKKKQGYDSASGVAYSDTPEGRALREAIGAAKASGKMIPTEKGYVFGYKALDGTPHGELLNLKAAAAPDYLNAIADKVGRKMLGRSATQAQLTAALEAASPLQGPLAQNILIVAPTPTPMPAEKPNMRGPVPSPVAQGLAAAGAQGADLDAAGCKTPADLVRSAPERIRQHKLRSVMEKKAQNAALRVELQEAVNKCVAAAEQTRKASVKKFNDQLNAMSYDITKQTARQFKDSITRQIGADGQGGAGTLVGAQFQADGQACEEKTPSELVNKPEMAALPKATVEADLLAEEAADSDEPARKLFVSETRRGLAKIREDYKTSSGLARLAKALDVPEKAKEQLRGPVDEYFNRIWLGGDGVEAADAKEAEARVSDCVDNNEKLGFRRTNKAALANELGEGKKPKAAPISLKRPTAQNIDQYCVQKMTGKAGIVGYISRLLPSEVPQPETPATPKPAAPSTKTVRPGIQEYLPRKP